MLSWWCPLLCSLYQKETSRLRRLRGKSDAKQTRPDMLYDTLDLDPLQKYLYFCYCYWKYAKRAVIFFCTRNYKVL